MYYSDIIVQQIRIRTGDHFSRISDYLSEERPLCRCILYSFQQVEKYFQQILSSVHISNLLLLTWRQNLHVRSTLALRVITPAELLRARTNIGLMQSQASQLSQSLIWYKQTSTQALPVITVSYYSPQTASLRYSVLLVFMSSLSSLQYLYLIISVCFLLQILMQYVNLYRNIPSFNQFSLLSTQDSLPHNLKIFNYLFNQFFCPPTIILALIELLNKNTVNFFV